MGQIILALCLGSLTYGYILAVITNTLGQPGFYTYFDLTTDTTDSEKYAYTNRIIGAINGIFSAGGVFGAIFSAWMSEVHGRKRTLSITAIITLIGGALQTGSVHVGMFLVGRFVSGFGAGMLITVVPVFQSEVAPPESRGMLVSLNGVLIVVAYSLAAWIGVACYFSANLAFQWRFPLAVQILWPLLLLATLPIVPESPRWLLANGNTEAAWKVLSKLHHGHHEGFARAEFEQMLQQISADKAVAENETLWDLFRKPSYRKRCICAFLVMYAGQASGNLVIARHREINKYSDYSVIIYQDLGQTGVIPLILAAVYCSVSVFLNYLCALLIDRIGRVNLFNQKPSDWLTVESALLAEYIGASNPGGLKAATFFIFFFIVWYGGCIDANTYVYCAEIFPTHIRPRGMALSMVTLYVTSTPFLEGAPTAFATIGWKYYLVFIVLTAINIPIMYFYLPETKGITLEEISGKFGDDVVIHLNESEGKVEVVETENVDKEAGRYEVRNREFSGKNVSV
ncbi:general substrate transporter [Talaromyces proteolyticus]|uniref:General substrate transporter n=1 Tax=Talaromyces proteolyticus TaxID=1131652 RepID=A0AAD4PX07_9EURO|nr:general substrate transporter [Talaromyces proteolyticus]KAH8692581.1 general substrate transporter [Talaromyces proteolyticus]